MSYLTNYAPPTLLTRCHPSRWNDFLAISNTAAPTTFENLNENSDLFVGKDMAVTIMLKNTDTLRVRDIVVLGILKIRSTNRKNPAVPQIFARDIFIPGVISMDHAGINFRTLDQPKNVAHFRKTLETLLLLEELDFQKESATKMGLRTFLV